MSANPRSPESGESTEPVEVVNALRWVAERARDGSTLYLDPADAAVYEAYAACVESLTAELSSDRERADRAEQRLDYLAQWGFVRAGSAWCPDAQEMVGHFEWVQPGCWATLRPMPGRDDAWEQDQYVECDIPLRDAIDAAMTSTPTPTPDHA